MPILSETLTSSRTVGKALQAHAEFFRHCQFSAASLEGGDFDGVFVACSFKQIEWYWGLFNTAILVDCVFEGCTFRGTSFAGCRMVNCIFRNCRFLSDNLDAPCSAWETSVYGCQFEGCEGSNALFENRAA
jgi:uncharacterized protein YjbI with pentapeptide repeats